MNDEAGAIGDEGSDFALEPAEIAGAAVDGFLEQFADVAAIEGAREEVGGFGGRIIVGLRPAQEMIGFAGQSAHAGGGNIQQMAAILGAVGDAASGRGALVNEGDRESWSAAQEMRSEHGTAEAASDDYYIERRIAQRAAFRAGNENEKRVRMSIEVRRFVLEQSRGQRAGSWRSHNAFEIRSIEAGCSWLSRRCGSSAAGNWKRISDGGRLASDIFY